MLEEVSLFPVDEMILELARLLVVPRAIPVKAGLDAVHIAAAADPELPAYRERSDSARSGRILANHGYTKTTICTPEELV